MLTFGEKLKQIRSVEGMKPDAFAEKIGICRQLLYQYEADTQKPSLNRLGRICRALNMTAEEIMRGVEL